MTNPSDPNAVIRFGMQLLQDDIHVYSQSKGWWENHEELRKVLLSVKGEEGLQEADLLYKMSRTMLMVTELSEGVESLRHGDPPDDKVPEFSGYTVELADTMIRILDTAARFKLPVIDAVVAKMEVNRNRPYMHGGKAI